jgi:hypothetical protein
MATLVRLDNLTNFCVEFIPKRLLYGKQLFDSNVYYGP